RETAPAAASANMYLDAKGNVIPDDSLYGYRAVGVPGTVAGLDPRRFHDGMATDFLAQIATLASAALTRLLPH
ncbi:gamma-glutamyltransferase, partial [Burkholderia sp. Ac-20345]|uniref:gamma-glutamyltransferase n=1 Tax=Burkholderia sp. Ac-20345 TaxID=2703891 RepID=UPI001F1210F0